MSANISSLADLQSEVAIYLCKAGHVAGSTLPHQQAEVFHIRYFSYINITQEESEEESLQVLLKDIMYFEILDDDYLLIHLHRSASKLLSASVQSLFMFLQRYYFLKVNSFCYVNIVYISGLQKGGLSLALDSGTQLPVESSCRDEVEKAMKHFYSI